MLTFATLANKPTVFQQLTGLSLDAFRDILPAFVRAVERLEQQADAQRAASCGKIRHFKAMSRPTCGSISPRSAHPRAS